MNLLFALPLLAWPPEQPTVEEVVGRVMWVRPDGQYEDFGIGTPIPLPSTGTLRATLWLLDGAGEERRASFEFDDSGRAVHETKYGPFGGPSELETTREYGPFGLVCCTSKASYDSRPTTTVRTYDERGTLLATEWRASDGSVRSAMLLPTTEDRLARVLVVVRMANGACEEQMHSIEGDVRGRALRRTVDRGAGEVLLDRWDLDDDGKLLRWVALNEALNYYSTRTLDRLPGRVCVDTWGNQNEWLHSEDHYSFGSGTWIERSGPRGYRASTELLDETGRVIRWIQTQYEKVLRSEITRYRFDACGNLIERRNTVLLPRADRDQAHGYRFDVEYREPK